MHPLRAEPPADLEASVGRWARLLAEAALDLDGPELRRFLDRVLPHDADLRQEVENLLLADREAARFLAQPALGERPPCAVDPESLLERGFLGPYRLEGLLGRGGMGRVFLARRRAGEVRRVLSSSRGAGKACEERPVEGPVALKVAREGHLLGERLGQEGRILARLSHPAIASVLGAGTLEGLPYLAMEFVDGLPIDRYLAERSWREVVTLLAEVCEGVEYAHRNLVLHRDLKPANILVTTHGKPKIVDFGVAKLLEESGRVLGISTMTRLAGSPATPAYASPEQLLGRPLTTASDT
ncbi:MAG: serine/threonine protein kinase, partial [Acidobacteria bacterium]|nr:serine/threonine protein kinase [Acidobacteriota bacterium]